MVSIKELANISFSDIKISLLSATSGSSYGNQLNKGFLCVSRAIKNIDSFQTE